MNILIAIVIFLVVVAVCMALLGYAVRHLPVEPVLVNVILAVAALIALLLFLQQFGHLATG